MLEGGRLGSFRQSDDGARGSAEGDQRFQFAQSDGSGIARRPDQVDDVSFQLAVKINFVKQGLKREQRLRGNRAAAHRRHFAETHRVQNPKLFVPPGISDIQFHEKTVDLRLRKRIGSLLIDGILCRQNKKRFRQREGFVAERYLPLLHTLQQSRLNLRRSAVDFVRQNDVGKNRTFLCRKCTFLRIVTFEVGVDDLRQNGNRQRLCQSGNAFKQNVTAANQRRQETVDHRLLSDNDLRRLGFDFV